MTHLEFEIGQDTRISPRIEQFQIELLFYSFTHETIMSIGKKNK